MCPPDWKIFEIGIGHALIRLYWTIAKRHWARSLNQAFLYIVSGDVNNERSTTTIDTFYDHGRIAWFYRSPVWCSLQKLAVVVSFCVTIAAFANTRELYCDHYYIAFLRSNCIRFDCQRCDFIPMTLRLAFFSFGSLQQTLLPFLFFFFCKSIVYL